MNARQKAKKLKKELDFIKSLPMPIFEKYNTNIKTLQVKQTVDTGYLYELSPDANDCPLTYVQRELVRQLAEKIFDDVKFNLEPSRMPYHTDITGRVTIVVERG